MFANDIKYEIYTLVFPWKRV